MTVPSAALQGTALDSTANQSTPYTVDGGTVVAGESYVLFVAIGHTSAAPPTITPTASGVTFTELLNSGASGGVIYGTDQQRRLQAWTFVAPSSAALSITATPSSEAEYFQGRVVALTDADDSAPVVQAKFFGSTNNTGTSVSVTLDAYSHADNRPLAFAACRGGSAVSIAEEAGYTDIYTGSVSSPTNTSVVEFHPSTQDTTPSASWSNNQGHAIIALEIKGAGGSVGAAPTPAVIARSFVLGAPVLSTSVARGPDTIARSFTLPAALAATGTTPAPAVIARSFTLPAAAPSASAAGAPATLAGTFSLPAPEVTTGAAPTPALVERAFVLPAAVGGAAAEVTPATVERAFVLGAAVLSTGATPTPETLALAFALPAVEVSTATTEAPALLVGTFSLGAATVGVGQIAAPALLSIAVTFPEFQVFAGGSAFPAPVVIERAFALGASVAGVGQIVAPATLTGAFSLPEAIGGVSARPDVEVVALAFALPEVLVPRDALVAVGVLARSFILAQALALVPAVAALGESPIVLLDLASTSRLVLTLGDSGRRRVTIPT